MKQVLGDFFDEICDRFSERECIYFPTNDMTYTYESFKVYVHDIEKGLIALGLKKGDLIAIKSENTPEWLAMQWAGFKLGIVVVGLNAALTQIEVMRAMNHTGAKILFTDDMSYMISELTANNQMSYRIIIWDSTNQFIIDLGCSVSEAVVEEMNMAVEATDTALILFTSGTTSEPKAVEIKNSAIAKAIEVYGKNLTYGENENALMCTPFAHMMGCLYGIIPVFNVGGKITILEKFKTSRVLEIISEERCTIFNGVPTMFLFLLNEYKDEDISSLRTGLIAGSYVSPQLYERIYKELGVTELLQAFGQTETLAVTGTNINDPFEKRMYSTGRALENVEIKIDYNTSLEKKR
ncbi:long-chain fatty acid--CoA ligase [Cellulosilyticum ruminicola]|uniref:long-chain fatty acid--CoA ligase n=1 Tax=Cellulosilyticum ruminicola TaxID=425254 RepID=UPI0006CF7991|nr:long-chain fatty acid--CoA ligase [Cellulosilyticum ruminicola]